MRKNLILSVIVLFTFSAFAQENGPANNTDKINSANSNRNAELDQFWSQLAKTVREGDLEGYASGYHDDAVVVFGNQKSVPIDVALEGWKQGFVDTKAGKAESNVEFRFSQRVGDETTAYETGMFFFTLADSSGKKQEYYANFEALLVKKDGSWKCILEYQKSPATKAEWEALK